MTDKDIGLKVFQTLFKWCQHLYPKSFNHSFQDFLNKIQPNLIKQGIYLDGVGMGVRESGISDSRIDSAMKKLAQQSNGRVLSNMNDVFAFLSNESVKINWLDAAAFTAVESAKDVLKASEAVGSQLILTGKILNFLLPAILLFFAFIWMNNASGGQALKFAKSFKK